MRSRSGFTLLEILVVVLIITVLATIVGVNVAREPGKARRAAAAAQIGAFETALRIYRMDHGVYPSQQQGLAALCRPPDDLARPEIYPPTGYLERMAVPQDPWGNEYVYLVPGPGNLPFEVISYGADGEPGGEGEATDIGSAAH